MSADSASEVSGPVAMIVGPSDEAAGIDEDVKVTGPTLKGHLAIAAAEAGQGFAIADAIQAADALIEKRLVSPFDLVVRHHAYYLVRGQVRGRLEDHLRSPRRDAEERAGRMLESERWRTLLADLVDLSEHEPEGSEDDARKRLRKDWRRMNSGSCTRAARFAGR